jgi:LuxR family transcriptional regulator, maltose regulon positive regulatory protein
MVMPDPMLHTRLTVPPHRAGLIFRARLIDHLQAGIERGIRLVLISAPAGSGKSTLASEWAAHYRAEAAGPRFAWLALDPTDNQDPRFWLGLIGALQSALAEVGQAAQRLLTFPDAPPLRSILTGLLNEIGARPERVILILDDYHVIDAASIHEGVAFLLENLPANLQLVIATRADPPLPLSRLRVRDQLLEIRAADLFFSLPESEMLLNDVLGLGLSAGDLAALEERTEGWAAGVQLAAVLLTNERRRAPAGQAGERLSAAVARLSGRQHLIADYLVDEVVSRQTSEIQRFLLESSVLDALCAPLCDALLGEEGEMPGSQAVLETLERANLFLIPLDEEHTWFRYHHLFADALRIRLERTQPGAARSLHQRASRWYAANGHAEAAIGHAFAAGDADRAAGLIEAAAPSFSRQGRAAPLLAWLEQIPAQTVLSHPLLSIWSSRALVLSGKLAGAEQQLQVLEAAAEGAPALLTTPLRGQIAAVRATAAILSANPLAAKEQAQRALDLLDGGDPSRAAVMLICGDAALMTGDIPRGIEWLNEAIAHSRASHNLTTLLMACAHLTVGLSMLGRLRQVEAVCHEALDEASSQLGEGDWPLPTLALIYTRLGGIQREWNDLAGAEQALTHAVRIAENGGYLNETVNAYGGLAALRRSQGDLPRAIELVEKAMQAVQRRESTLFHDLCLAQRAEYWALSGSLPAARRWATERGLSAGREIDYLGEEELYALARLWIAEERADEADALAGRLVAFAEASGQPGHIIAHRVLQALARRGAGRLDLAEESLERALVLGEPEGYLRTFLDEGAALMDLLRRIARKKSPASAYARQVLAAGDPAGGPAQQRGPSALPQAALVEPLTDRELAVLRQMAAGSSNQEIAQRLVISIGTVKAHIYHISAKLGARSRTEAVVRAREAGLLP